MGLMMSFFGLGGRQGPCVTGVPSVGCRPPYGSGDMGIGVKGKCLIERV